MIGTIGHRVVRIGVIAALIALFSSPAAAQEQIKPRILLIFDTSGSMVWSVGPGGFMDRTNGDGSMDPWIDGTFCCPGRGNSRLFHAKEAVRQMIFATGDIDFALMKFVQEYVDGPGGIPIDDPLYYGNQVASVLDTIPYQADSKCVWPPGGDDIFFAPYGTPDDYKWLCAEFPADGEDNRGAVMMWMDHHQYSSTNLGEIDDAPVFEWSRANDGLEQELRAIGSTPIAKSLYAAHDYLSAVYDSDYSEKGEAAACRPYSVVLLTDGDEACGGDTGAASSYLHTINHVSGAKTVDIWVIGFSRQGNSEALDQMAENGGTEYARSATNATELSGVLYDIVSDSLLVESCNGEDDDCDGEIDEGFEKYCDYGEADGCGTVADADLCDRPSECACDGIDNNCDGVTDELPDGAASWPVETNACGGCDPTEAGQAYCVDPEEGRCERGDLICSPGTGYECVGSVDPVPETCNGLDDDCDGLTDEEIVGEACGPCGDGNWTCISGQTVCCGAGSTGTTCEPTDIPSVEVCNAEDDDCDGETDEDVMRGCGGCDDVDCGDPNEGVCAEGQEVCTMGEWGDCSADIGPSEEICDLLDNDCDGETDEGIVGAQCGACDDGNWYCIDGGEQCCSGVGGDGSCTPVQTPSAEDCDGIDNNCNGLTDESLAPRECDDGGYGDQMGIGECAVGYQICTDGEWGNVNPTGGEWEAGYCLGRHLPTDEICDGLDNDCDGDTDEDLSGQGGCGPCGDGRSECINGILQCVGGTSPEPEVCNGVDDNCNSLTDEGILLYCGGCALIEEEMGTDTEIPEAYADCLAAQEENEDIGPGEGECQEGARYCDPDADDLWGACQGGIGPAAELCDDKDNDCDGTTDEEDEIENVNESCATAVGICEAGWWRCVDEAAGGKSLQCCAAVTDEGLCDPPQGPVAEICDGLDNDCDGEIDEELDNAGESCGHGVGDCAAGTIECVCETEGDPESCEMICVGAGDGTDEVCDGRDNDCDGQTDEDLPVGNECTNAPGDVPTGECDLGYEECINGAWVCIANEPGEEICDGLDNDCDGTTDENLTVECPDGSLCIEGDCAPSCVGEELQCPPGLACVDAASDAGTTVRICSTDVCRQGSASALPCVENPYWCDDGYDPLCKCNQAQGKCVTICDEVLCPAGKTCVPSTGQCQNIDDACYAAGCTAGEVCRGGECVTDPCDGKACGVGEYCNYDGECVEPCVDIQCPGRCFEGACVDRCDGVSCDSGEVCNEVTGTCEPEGACDTVRCKYYEVCRGGTCVEDPCFTIECPNGLVCEDGSCRRFGDEPSTDTDTDSDDTDSDSDDTDTAEPGDTERDTGPDQSYGMDRVLATGMGGCLCNAAPGAAPNPASWWLAAFGVFGLLIRFGRRRLSTVRVTLSGVIVLGMLLALGCTTEPYVFNKPQDGNGTDDSDGPSPSDNSSDPTTGETDSDESTDPEGCDSNHADDDCDGVDDDCDGETDEGVNLQTSSQFCGSCDNDCRENYDNAFGLCSGGECTMGDCVPSYHDMNGDDEDGCEYYCTVRADADQCNGVDLGDGSYRGVDDDCDGETDEESDLSLQTDPFNCGRCGNVCRVINAAARCVSGECAFDPATDCNADFHDLNGDAADGCEYACQKIADEETACDNRDEDCDGMTDEGNPGGGGACYTLSAGCTVDGKTVTCPENARCEAGAWACIGHTLVCDGQTGPAPVETCNGIDDNCNGEVDEGLILSCTTGGDDFREIGVCRKGYRRCENGVFDEDVCEGETLPTPEQCDGFDNDCDGQTDEGEDGAPLIGKTCGQCGGREYCFGGQKACCLGVDDDGACIEPRAPEAEVCNGFDDDCDGITDNIPPVLCDSPDDADACKEGMETCLDGAVVCSDATGDNPEVCDGLDNDCDNLTDEEDPDLQDPEEGFCRESCGDAYEGVQCMGTAGWQCSYDCDAVQCNAFDQVVATETICDGIDNDCDGATDEGLLSTAENCGACGNNCWDTAGENVLSLVCLAGECRVSECEAGYHNLDGDLACEYGPCSASDEGTACDGVDNDCDGLTDEGLATAEVCDGEDNDCDGETDEFETLPDICNNRCQDGSFEVRCNGAAGWSCHYDCDVLDCEGGDDTVLSTGAESACDGIDNNCDGTTDEGFLLWSDRVTSKNALCVSDGVGGCSQVGWVKCGDDGASYVCCDEQSGDGCATENVIPEVPAPGIENGTAADGVDNDCDGTVDDGADGCVETVSISGPDGSYEIFKYEATKRVAAQKAPCAEAQLDGESPWTNISFADARAACLRLNDNDGACSYETPDGNGDECWDLCTAEQWYYACAYGAPAATVPHLYPYGDAYNGAACNGADFDTDDGPVPAGDAAQCISTWNGGADTLSDMSGNVEEWTLNLRAVNSTDLRVIRGGSYKALANGMTCDFNFLAADESDFQMEQLGFRCCKGADPISSCQNAIDTLSGNPATFEDPSNSSTCNWDGWWVNSSLKGEENEENWELGRTSLGVVNNSSCLYATRVNGDYTYPDYPVSTGVPDGHNYLFSSPVDLSPCEGIQVLLTWNMYFDNGGDVGDYLYVRARTSDDNGATWTPWSQLGDSFSTVSTDWSTVHSRIVSESIVAATLYQVQFVFISDGDANTAPGAYLDNLRFVAVN